MAKLDKIRAKVLSGQSDANVAFDDLCYLFRKLEFRECTKGSHFIFTKAGVVERINLQRHGSKAKPYQMKQVRKFLENNPHL